jgi:LysR family hydrogen peroxide-inducible transcriptional activator
VFPKALPDKQIETIAVFTEPLVLGVAPQHRLAQYQRVHMTALQTEEFIVFKPGSGLRQTVMYMAQQADFVPRVIFESGDISSIRALVAEGVGISVFPQSTLHSPGKTIIPLTVQPTLPQRTILLAWHRQRASSPGIKAFLAFFREDIAAHPWAPATDDGKSSIAKRHNL